MSLEKNETLKRLQTEARDGTLLGLRDIPAEIYHDKECPGLTRGAILELLKSPRHYQEWLITPNEPTPKMIFGSHCHTALLEPEKFETNFTCYPNEETYEGQSKIAKEARAEFQKANEGKTILKSEDFSRIGKIIQSVYSKKEAIEALKGVKEKTFFKSHDNGVLFKVKPDCFLEGTRIVDLKVTGNASEDGFKRIAAQLDYEVQVAFYLDATALEDFRFLCVEDAEPFEVAIYSLDEASIDLGRRKYNRAAELFKSCQEKKAWPGYSLERKFISLPAWKFHAEGELL